MRIIDEKGRLFGRFSVIDLLLILTVLVLGLGYAYKKTSGEVQQIVYADTPFYVTLKCDQMRAFTVDALSEGDIIYKRYETQPLGSIVKMDVEQSKDILLKTDGTALLAPMEERYTVYLTLACSGSVTDAGYFVNGSLHMAEGGEFQAHSYRALLNAVVYAVGETMP